MTTKTTEDKEVMMQEKIAANRAIWAQDIFLGKKFLDNSLPEPYLILYDRETLDFSILPGVINTIAREKGYRLVSLTSSTDNMLQAIMEKIITKNEQQK